MAPAKEVGGDFYDFFLIDQNHLGFAIGDVSGKGVPAALFMAVCKTVLKTTALKGLPPEECLQQVNRILHLESVASMFVTVFYGILDLASGEVAYCNGGHLPPCKIGKDGTVIAIETTGSLALGVLANAAYKTKTISLNPGEGLFLYTDGITEAMDANNLEYGEERLLNSLQQSTTTAKDITHTVINSVKTFSAGLAQSDDMTVLSLYYL
jgi:sigma-B regulation protein RsbU (phosphoserine phosphatase)